METPANEPVNPFAPSAVEANALPLELENSLWRHGKKLVILKGTEFPPICVKSGVPAETSIHKTFSWVQPILYISILVGLLPAIVILLVFTKKAKFAVPISFEIESGRKRGVMIGWMIALAGLLIGVAGVVLLVNDTAVGGGLLILAIVAMLAGLVVGSRASSLITPARITADFAWFNGVHENLLASLPVWDERYEKEYRAQKRRR